MSNALVWVVIGIVIIGCMIGGIILYNWMQEGQEYAESGDTQGWANWFAGGLIVVVIIAGIALAFSKK